MDSTLQIIRDLTTLGDSVMWIVGPGDMVSENYSHGIQEPQVHGQYVTVRAHNWLFHIEPEMVNGIEFVETHGDLRSFYVKFVDHAGETMLRAYVPCRRDGGSHEGESTDISGFEELLARYAAKTGIELVSREVRSQGESSTP